MPETSLNYYKSNIFFSEKGIAKSYRLPGLLYNHKYKVFSPIVTSSSAIIITVFLIGALLFFQL